MYYTTQSLKSAVAHFIANGSETEKEIAKAIRGNGYDNVENTVFMFTENTDIAYDDCIAAKQAIEAMAEEMPDFEVGYTPTNLRLAITKLGVKQKRHLSWWSSRTHTKAMA